MRRVVIAVLALLAYFPTLSAHASTEGPDVGDCGFRCSGPAFGAEDENDASTPGAPGSPGSPGSPGDTDTPRYYDRVAWIQACRENHPEGENLGCQESTELCTEPALMYLRWLQRIDRLGIDPPGDWRIDGRMCRQPDEPEEPRPSVDQIHEAFKRLPLRKATLHVQPGGRTLIGLDTIFYTQMEEITFDVTLLETDIDFRAEPEEYVWDFGDGDTQTSDDPGQPFPDHTVTHAYSRAGVKVRPSVAVVWKGEYRIQGETAWNEVPDRVVAEGNDIPLAVASATGQLVEGPE